MAVVDGLLMRAFGRPTGLLGRIGGRIMARVNEQMARRAVELLDVRPTDRVLEIGFGPGVAIEILAGAAPAGKIAGVDPSDVMVAQARARNAAAVRAGLVDLRRGTADRLPFDDASFDRALAINSMQVWPDPVAGLREVRRVLAPGGRIVLAFTPHSGQPRDGVTEALGKAGFADAHLVDGPDGTGFCAVATRR